MKKIALWTLASAVIMVSCFSCKGKPSVKQEGLTLQPCSLNVRTHLNDDPTKKSLDISLSIEFPSAYADEVILNKVRNTVLFDFFPESDSAFSDPMAALNAYVKDYNKFFQDTEIGYSELEEDKENDGLVQDDPWYNYEKMLVRYNADGLFSYTIFSDRYTGGAHGGKTYLNAVINLADGKRITEDDLFTTESKPLIIKMIINKILEKNQTETVAALEEIGFFDIAEISLNKNFYLNEMGITYTYNEYEIAGYAVGATEVFLGYQSLADFMKPGHPIEALMN